MIFTEDVGTGYLYCYNPGHYCANKAGKVLEHVFVMSEHIGRPLVKGECVHHKDRDRKNNSLDNLQLMTIIEHAKLHCIEDRDTVYKEVICPGCNKLILTTEKQNQITCSVSCATKVSRKFEISKELLQKLVWEMPTTHIAKLLDVSDTAIGKRCKLLGIDKPPRGYWTKRKAIK